MKLSKYYRKEHVGEDCYVLYNTLHMKPIIAKQDEVSKVENMGIHDPAVVEELLHSGIYVLDDSIDSNALIELQSKIIFACRLRLTEKFYLIKVKWVNTIIYGSHKPNTHHIQISLGDHGRIPSGLPCGHIRPSIAVRHHRRPENTPQRHRTACGVWRGYCQRPQGSEPLPCGDPSL